MKETGIYSSSNLGINHLNELEFIYNNCARGVWTAKYPQSSKVSFKDKYNREHTGKIVGYMKNISCDTIYTVYDEFSYKSYKVNENDIILIK